MNHPLIPSLGTDPALEGLCTTQVWASYPSLAPVHNVLIPYQPCRDNPVLALVL